MTEENKPLIDLEGKRPTEPQPVVISWEIELMKGIIEHYKNMQFITELWNGVDEDFAVKKIKEEAQKIKSLKEELINSFKSR